MTTTNTAAQPNSESDSHLLDNDCRGFWKHPRNCSPEKHNCEYYARWETIGRGDEMRFHIETSHTNTWTGIGFSNDNKMPQTDAVIGWVDKNGRPFLMDAWMSGYQNPIIDSPTDKQNIYNTTGRLENGVTTLEFTRKRVTNDKAYDLSFTDDHCLYLVFPINGGGFHEVNKKIRKHEQTPIVTENRVCIKSCGKELEEQFLATSTVAPDRLIYAVGVKLTNLAQSFEVPKKGTPDFDILAGKVEESFNGVLNDIPGYYKVDVQMFNKAAGAVVAKMNVLFDRDAYEKGMEKKMMMAEGQEETNGVADMLTQEEMMEGKIVKRAIQESLATGKVGALNVDPNYLDFNALESE